MMDQDKFIKLVENIRSEFVSFQSYNSRTFVPAYQADSGQIRGLSETNSLRRMRFVHLKADPGNIPPDGNVINYQGEGGGIEIFGFNTIHHAQYGNMNGYEAGFENCFIGCQLIDGGEDGIGYTGDDNWGDCPCDVDLDQASGGEGNCNGRSYSTACIDYKTYWNTGVHPEGECLDTGGEFSNSGPRGGRKLRRLEPVVRRFIIQ